MKRFALLSLTFVYALNSFAAIERLVMPRSALKKFRTEGLFEGGSDVKANIEDLRIAEHDGYERWVLDFSDIARKHIDKVAPRYQLRYVPGDFAAGADGNAILRQNAKFILSFRQIQKSFLSREKLAALVKKSKWVQEIIVYPPIEKGDLAIEIVLKDNVAFSPHQPTEREGRLVLDLKAPGEH